MNCRRGRFWCMPHHRMIGVAQGLQTKEMQAVASYLQSLTTRN